MASWMRSLGVGTAFDVESILASLGDLGRIYEPSAAQNRIQDDARTIHEGEGEIGIRIQLRRIVRSCR
jgi:hypothetical protein